MKMRKGFCWVLCICMAAGLLPTWALNVAASGASITIEDVRDSGYETINMQVSLRNETDEAINNAVVHLVFYDSAGEQPKQIAAMSAQVSVDERQGTSVSFVRDVDVTAARLIKAFVWDENLAPLSDVYVVKEIPPVLTLNNTMIEAYESNQIIYWEKAEDRFAKTVTLSPDAQVVYNGVPARKPFYLDLLVSDRFYGEVTLSSAQQGAYHYDTVNIKNITNLVVDQVDTAAHTVTAKNMTRGISFAPDDSSVNATLHDEAGNQLSFEDLKEWDVISCLIAGTDLVHSEQETITATLVRRTVVGQVTAISSASDPRHAKYRINGTDYALDQRVMRMEDIMVGDRGTFYLDARGNIVYYRASRDENYAYVMEAWAIGGISQRTELKLFLSNGEVRAVKTAYEVKVDGITGIDSADLANEIIEVDPVAWITLTPRHGIEHYEVTGDVVTGVAGIKVGDFFRYTMNSWGEIATIDRAFCSGVTGGFARLTQQPVAEYEYNAVNKRFWGLGGPSFLADDKTVIMVCPGGTEEESYAVWGIGDLLDCAVLQNATAYSMDMDDRIASVIVAESIPNTSINTFLSVARGLTETTDQWGQPLLLAQMLRQGEVLSIPLKGDKSTMPQGSVGLPTLRDGNIRQWNILAEPKPGYTAFYPDNVPAASAGTYTGGRVVNATGTDLDYIPFDRGEGTLYPPVCNPAGGDMATISVTDSANVYVYDATRALVTIADLGYVDVHRATASEAMTYGIKEGQVIYDSFDPHSTTRNVEFFARQQGGKTTDVMLFVYDTIKAGSGAVGDTLVVKSSQIAGVQGKEITYYESHQDTTAKRLTVSPNPGIVYNGVPVGADFGLDLLADTGFYGDVTFSLSRQGNYHYDTVNIRNGINVVVDSVDATTHTVAAKNTDTVICFDGGVNATLHDEAGNQLSFGDLKEWDVISCLIADTGLVDGEQKTITATLVRRTVVGQVTAISSATDSRHVKYCINGTDYGLDQRAMPMDDIMVGDKGTFYLDTWGNIVYYYIPPMDNTHLAYVMDTAYMGEWGALQLYLSTSGAALVEVADQVILDGISGIDGTEVMREIIPLDAPVLLSTVGPRHGTEPYIIDGGEVTGVRGIAPGDFFHYVLNAQGEIIAIDRATCQPGRGSFTQYTATPKDYTYQAEDGEFICGDGASFAIDDKTVIMICPDSTDEDDYELWSIANLEDGDVLEDAIAYNVDADSKIATAVVVYTTPDASTNAPFAIVKGTGKTENAQGEIVLEAALLRGGEVGSYLTTDEDLSMPQGSVAIPGMSGNAIKKWNIMARPRTGYTELSEAVLANLDEAGPTVTYTGGRVVNVKGTNVDYVSFAQGDSVLYAEVFNPRVALVDSVSVKGEANIYVYDVTRTTASRVTIDDLSYVDVRRATTSEANTYAGYVVDQVVYDSFDASSKVKNVEFFARLKNGRVTDLVFFVYNSAKVVE